MNDYLIPARGTVEFLVYPMHFDADGHFDENGKPDIVIGRA
jgi:hypothetical protein